MRPKSRVLSPFSTKIYNTWAALRVGGFRLFLAKPAHVLISRMNGEIEKPNIVFDKEFEEYYEMF